MSGDTSCRRPSDVQAQLAEQARTGDGRAFERLCVLYEPELRSFLYRSLQGYPALPELIDDLLQDAYLKAWRSIRLTKSPLLFRGWLWRILTNTMLDFCRRQKVIKWQPFLRGRSDDLAGASYAIEPDVQAPHQHAVILGSIPPPSPEDEVLRREESATLQALITELRPAEQQALCLQVYGGLSMVEIAARLGTTDGNVKSLLYRARQRLRVRWTELGESRAA